MSGAKLREAGNNPQLRGDSCNIRDRIGRKKHKRSGDAGHEVLWTRHVTSKTESSI